MEATPPPAEPRKRGRPKGSTKAKAEKDRETSGGGAPAKMRGSAGDRKNTAADETYTHWKQLVPVLYDWLASHNLVWPSLSCRYILRFSFVFQKVLVRVYLIELQRLGFNFFGMEFFALKFLFLG